MSEPGYHPSAWLGSHKGMGSSYRTWDAGLSKAEGISVMVSGGTIPATEFICQCVDLQRTSKLEFIYLYIRFV